jgi:hypothetical protein
LPTGDALGRPLHPSIGYEPRSLERDLLEVD